MIAFIQSLEDHVFTFKEVAGYVTIAVCMAFAVGFLIAAFTRIFKERRQDEIIEALKEDAIRRRK